MSDIPPGYYHIVLNIPQLAVATFGDNGVDITKSTEGERTQWYIQPISGTKESNVYTIQNGVTGTYVIPGFNCLNYDINPYAWTIRNLTDTRISNNPTSHWTPDSDFKFVIGAQFESYTWNLKPISD